MKKKYQMSSYISVENYNDFDPENIIFDAAKSFQGESGQKFHRIPIKYKYPDGNTSGLVLETPDLFTFGISNGNGAFKKEIATPQLTLVTFDAKCGPTKIQTKFIAICNEILAKIKTHMSLEDTKDEIGKWDIDNDIKSMRIFYIKTDKGKPIKGAPPMLYSKLYYNVVDGEQIITTRIVDWHTDAVIPPKPFLGRGTVFCTLYFTNIFIGAKPSIQTRIGEIMVKSQMERVNMLKSKVAEEKAETVNYNEPPTPVLKLKSFVKHNK
uniref:p31k protein n=1 Tax=Rhinella marina erythrocytic-like virus TaxID=2859906 RepID=A0A8F6YHY9_9VIRU|nr:p31k protein [Rhinella marina erythrocytic-like virus]